MKTLRMTFLLANMKRCVKCWVISIICLMTMIVNKIWMTFLLANMKAYCESVGYQRHMPDNYDCDLDQCSKWTGMHRNGVPVHEMDGGNRSVSSRYARTHQNAVPVRHFSIIITFHYI